MPDLFPNHFVGDLVQTPAGYVVVPPTACPQGHSYDEPGWSVSSTRCTCNGWHTEWRCHCGRKVYAPQPGAPCRITDRGPDSPLEAQNRTARRTAKIASEVRKMSGMSTCALDIPFRIVTHRNWLAQHFAEFGAVQDYGFDIDPDTAENTYWWAPGAWVACAYQSGIRLPLTLCGHRWMEELAWQHKQRTIVVRKVEDIENQPQASEDERWHVKLPEAKLDSFPARLFGRRYLADNLKQYHVPDGTLIQLSQPVNFVRECRFWIAHGRITAHSWYLIDGSTPDCERFPTNTPVPDNMFKAALAVLSDTDCPPGFTLDMGLTDDDRVLVVEANAAWSSSPYNGDPSGIVESIIASHDFDAEHARWRWRPNPVYGTVQPLRWAKPVNTGGFTVEAERRADGGNA